MDQISGAQIAITPLSTTIPPKKKRYWKTLESYQKINQTEIPRFFLRWKNPKNNKYLFYTQFGQNQQTVLEECKVARNSQLALKRWNHPFKLSNVQFRPNILILVLDSTSRREFAQEAPFFLRKLRKKYGEKGTSGSRLFEFIRYTTVGFKTPHNIRGLLKGCSNSENCINHIPLSKVLSGNGYAIMGRDTLYAPNKQKPLLEILVDSKISRRGCRYGRRGLGLNIEFMMKMNQEFETRCADVPRFLALHDSDRHDLHYKNCQQCLLKLLDLDLTNTILYIVGDHGKQDRQNPVSLLVVPNRLITPSLIENQYRMVSHFDMYWTLLGWGTLTNTWKSTRFFNRNHYMLYQTMGNQSCVHHKCDIIAPKTRKWATNLSIQKIPWNRTCVDANIPEKWCLCHKRDTVKELNVTLFQEIGRQVVSLVNRYTGNGSYDCRFLEQKNFQVVGVKQYNNRNAYLEIQERRGKLGFRAELSIHNGYWNISFPPYNLYGQRGIPHIRRLDRFSEESCLFLDPLEESFHPPTFKSGVVNLFKDGKYSDQWNLRWCSCKSR